MMRKARGFTLIEVWAALAIIGVLAAIAFSIARYARGNATLASATFEIVQKVRGLRFRAMSENADYVFVVSDSNSGNALDCSWTNAGGCVQWWILKLDPTVSWSLAAPFDPDSPTTKASYEDHGVMPRGVHLAIPPPAFSAPPPFDAVKLDDSVHNALTLTCRKRACFAIRFTATGKVVPDPANADAAGYAFALAPEGSVDIRETRIVLVSFPAGIVKVLGR